MGAAAVKHDSGTVARRPRLHVVKPGTRHPAAGKSSPKLTPSRAHAAAKETFVFFAVIVGVVALLGVGRVWLSVQAAQASIDASELRREIKQERYRGDMLEIQQSALATPSRIQAIAGTTMGMAPATTVSYLDIRGGAAASSGTGAVAVSKRKRDELLVRVMDVAADEAQALLVGDVGLVSSQ